MRVGTWGTRLRGGLAPRDPTAYAIFGDSVYAPCSGLVLRAVDDLPDLSPPERDRLHMEGNHVLLDCRGVWILLAHLQQGSAAAIPGSTIRTGDLLGRVGNNGNSDEPHLHLHAQRPGSPDDPFSGEPLGIRLNGRVPVRNQVLRLPAVSKTHPDRSVICEGLQVC